MRVFVHYHKVVSATFIVHMSKLLGRWARYMERASSTYKWGQLAQSQEAILDCVLYFFVEAQYGHKHLAVSCKLYLLLFIESVWSICVKTVDICKKKNAIHTAGRSGGIPNCISNSLEKSQYGEYRRPNDLKNQTCRTTQRLHVSAHSVRVGKSVLAGTRNGRGNSQRFRFLVRFSVKLWDCLREPSFLVSGILRCFVLQLGPTLDVLVLDSMLSSSVSITEMHGRHAWMWVQREKDKKEVCCAPIF